jgi:adenosylcobinamide kinase/adenosylcobinamide-phosphate guanylyltransferase
MKTENYISAVTLVVGGTNSGKSQFAEDLIVQSGRPRRYIATAQAWDAEMRAKIKSHQVQRGTNWKTVEVPLEVEAALLEAQPSEIILLDCVTLWLSNLMMDGRDIEKSCSSLSAALQRAPCPVIIVSNEVGQGIIPDNVMARTFMKHQGHLNQLLALHAKEVYFVTAGLSQKLKGA